MLKPYYSQSLSFFWVADTLLSCKLYIFLFLYLNYADNRKIMKVIFNVYEVKFDKCILFENIFGDSALASPHTTTHKQQHRTSLTQCHRHHDLRTMWFPLADCFQFLNYSRKCPCNLQVLGHPLKSLFSAKTHKN